MGVKERLLEGVRWETLIGGSGRWGTLLRE